MSVQAGSRLRSGRYLLLGCLREGGSATIWRAIDTRENAERALKAIPLELDGARVAEIEAEVTARVSHPGVVRAQAAFVEAGHGWVVMDRAAGSLADAVEAHGPLDGALLRRVGRDLCAALAAAHAAGVVHRDLKPQNVLVFEDGRIQLADFGIAQVQAWSHSRTRTGALLGTLAYMAPEQRRDPRAVRPATDVYAMGVLLAWARTGRVPGELYVEEALDALRAELRAAGEPDDALVELIADCGAHDPARRPVDGAALLGRVAALPGAVADSTAPLAARVVTPDGPPEPPRNAPGAPAAAPRAGAPLSRIAVAVGGVALLAFGGGLWVGRVKQAAPAETQPDNSYPSCDQTWRAEAAQQVLGPREVVGVSVADLDGDGFTDAVFANQLDENLSIYWGDGAARLGVPQTLAVGRMGAAVATGDVDGDGRADLLVPDADHSELRLFQQTAPRSFAAGEPVEQPDLSSSRAPWLLRWDADTLLDLVVASEGGVKVRRGLGAGRFDTEQIRITDAQNAVAPWRRSGSTDAVAVLTESYVDLVESGNGYVPRRVTRWSLPALSLIPDTRTVRARVGTSLMTLKEDGAICRWATDAPSVSALADLDGDGLPEGLSMATCAGCTSNHTLVRGVAGP